LPVAWLVPQLVVKIGDLACRRGVHLLAATQQRPQIRGRDVEAVAELLAAPADRHECAESAHSAGAIDACTSGRRRSDGQNARLGCAADPLPAGKLLER